MLSKQASVILIKVLTGGLQYVIFKAIMHWQCDDINGAVGPDGKVIQHDFEKNYFLSLVSFFSMLLLIVPYFYKEIKDHYASRKEKGLVASYPYSMRAHLLTIFPGVLEVAGVLLSFYANKSLNATTMLLLKSLRIPISALMTKFLVGRSQKAYQWLAVAITIVALVPIGLAESAEKKKSSDDPIDVKTMISLGLLVLSEVTKGIRYVYEEKLIKLEKMSTEFVVFMESVVGLFICVFIVIAVHFIPSGNGQPVEDAYETYVYIKSSVPLQIMLVANIILCGVHHYTTTLITEYLSSVHSVLISQLRPIVTFVVCVGIYYITGHKSGEAITAWTALKVFGFALSVLAALLYNGNVRAPCDSCYPIEDSKAAEMAELDARSRSTSEGGDKKEEIAV